MLHILCNPIDILTRYIYTSSNLLEFKLNKEITYSHQLFLLVMTEGSGKYYNTIFETGEYFFLES